MRMFAIVFLFLTMAASAVAQQPVLFKGEGVTIVHDGSQTAYNPYTEAGRRLLREAREACCVEAPPGFKGQSQSFSFNADPDRHLLHEAKRFVINPHTGAFLSSTTLEDTKFPVTDPKRYVDSDMTPMVALSTEQAKFCGCKPGDRVLLTEPSTPASVWAIYGNNAGDQDQGMTYTGLSAAAAQALHIPLDPMSKTAKSLDYHITIAVFPGSGYGSHFPHGSVPPVVNK